MNTCPSAEQLQQLLKSQLPDKVRTAMEEHIESCPQCQTHLDSLTQAKELQYAVMPASALPTLDSGPAFLRRLREGYPPTAPDAGANGAIHFPGAASERAPLGQIGDFEILAELGSGTFGQVFRARERSLNRIVALKVLKPEMTVRPEALLRFEREARKASLRHDHVVTVYRFEKPDGFPPYLVMEFVEGETLEARLRREGKLAPTAAATIARQVALGLASAHEQGMVHRDIKPSNILLDKITGRAKITDFGLARDVVGESIAVTGAGEMAGTAPYMSPEHFRTPGMVDGRSDLFSLGVVLYQMLTGRLPFQGTFLQVRTGILEEEPAKPRRLDAAIPVDLDTITLACLEKDPQRRCATAKVLAEDLRCFLNGSPIQSRPTGAAQRAVKWMRRKPALAALGGVAMLALLAVVGLVIGIFFNAQLRAVNSDLVKTKADLQGANTKLVDKESYVRRLNYVADMNLAHQAWKNNHFSLLSQLLNDQDDPNLRGFEWQYLRGLANADGRHIGPRDRVTALTLDPSGRLLALGVWLGKEGPAQVQVWKTPSLEKPLGEMIYKLNAAETEITDLAFHAKKDLLIASDRGNEVRDGEVRIWEFKTNKKPRVLEGNAPLAVSPNGEVLAFAREDGRLQRWSFLTERDSHDAGPAKTPTPAGPDKGKAPKANEPKGKSKIPNFFDPKKLLKPKIPDPAKGKPGVADKINAKDASDSYSGFQQLAFSRDSQNLAAVGGYHKIVGFALLWDLKSNHLRNLEDAQQNDLLTGVAYSPDGQSFAAAGFDHTLRVWDAATGKLRFRRIAHQLEVLSVAFNSTGERLATAGWDHSIKIWNARTGEELRHLRGSRGIVRQVLFCPSPTQPGQDNLVSLNEFGELRWWNADEEQAAQVLRHASPVLSLAFSPDGKYLASIGRNAQIQVQNLANRDQRFDLASKSNATRAVFSRDGKALLTLDGDGGVKSWNFEKSKPPVDLATGDYPKDKIALVNQHFIAQKDGQFWVSEAQPSDFAETLVAFGKAPSLEASAVAVDANGGRFAIALHSNLIVLRHRERGTGNVVEKLVRQTGPKKQDAPVRVNALVFSPDGKFLAAGCQDNSILLWDTRSGTVRHHLAGHLCYVSCLAFSPDGKRLVSGSEDWTVKVWDLEVGRATLTLNGHQGRIRDLAFSPDGAVLASASEDGTVRLWSGAAVEAVRMTRDETSSLSRGRGGPQ